MVRSIKNQQRFRGVFLISIIGCFIFCNFSYSQNPICTDEVNTVYDDIVDSIWINQKLWKSFNSSTFDDPYLLRTVEDARKCILMKVPFFKIAGYELLFNKTNELFDGVILDYSGLWVIVYNHGKPIGRLNIVNNAGHYAGYVVDFFNAKCPMKKAITKMMRMEPDYLFSISQTDGLWYIKGNRILVYSFYKNRLMFPKSYIRKHNLESIIKSKNY